MRLMLPTMRTAARTAAMALLLALAGCNDGNAGASTSVPGAQGRSYHLVTQVRPESVEKYFARLRSLHQLCATAASSQGMTAKPFPRVPADFIVARNIYASDGKRVLSKEIKWTTDDSRFAPETGCELKLTTLWKSALVQDGKERAADFNNENGLVLHEAQAFNPQPLSESRMAMYSAQKAVNGVQLKCSTDDICIVDPALVLIKEGRSPVHVSERIKDGGANATVLVLEPVSLAVDKPVDPAIFNQENGK